MDTISILFLPDYVKCFTTTCKIDKQGINNLQQRRWYYCNNNTVHTYCHKNYDKLHYVTHINKELNMSILFMGGIL